MPADRLTGQLYHLPTIVGNMGLSIAEAQKQLNADYLDNIKFLLDAARQALPAPGGAAGDEAAEADRAKVLEQLLTLLKSLAPSRYQFSETVIDFSADLSESFNATGALGVGAGFGAVVVNAGLTVGFGYDYRAAARIKSVLHAKPSDPAMTGVFLAQSDKMDAAKLALPPRKEIDAKQANQLSDIMAALMKTDKQPPVTTDPATPPAGGGGGAGGGR